MTKDKCKELSCTWPWRPCQMDLKNWKRCKCSSGKDTLQIWHNLHKQNIFAEEITFFINHICIFVSWVKISECPPHALGPLQVIWIWSALNYWMHMPNSSMSQYLLYSKIHKHKRLIHECHCGTNFLGFRQISAKLFVGSELSLHCAGTERETGESWKVTFKPWDVCRLAVVVHNWFTLLRVTTTCAAEHLPRSGSLLFSMCVAISNKCTAARQKEGRKSGKQFLVEYKWSTGQTSGLVHDNLSIVSQSYGRIFVRLTLLLWTNS